MEKEKKEEEKKEEKTFIPPPAVQKVDIPVGVTITFGRRFNEKTVKGG